MHKLNRPIPLTSLYNTFVVQVCGLAVYNKWYQSSIKLAGIHRLLPALVFVVQKLIINTLSIPLLSHLFRRFINNQKLWFVSVTSDFIHTIHIAYNKDNYSKKGIYI